VVRWRHKDGSYRYLESDANPVLDESGELVGYRGVDRDITERKKAEDDRLLFEQQLLQSQKLESLGVLAGGIAHDFNNILTAILGNISYARMDLDASQRAYDPLVRAEKAVKKAAGLAKQLLAFSKGGEPLKKMISVRESVHDAVSLVLSGSSVEAVIDLPPDLHAINADEGQINQAFSNIIINAVQAMAEGGKLAISARNTAIVEGNSFGLPPGDYVDISFADEGCGIAPEDMGRIFDPYFTNKEDGSGLGLATTYAIIKKHGGHIAVNSSPGRGTTFTILIPGCADPVHEEAQEAPAADDARGGYSILVLDDDEMVRELAEITLKRFGYTVTCCDNGAAAVSLYRAARAHGSPFSLVVMDLTIPGGMGGIEAARQILAFDPQAQLIVSSGYSADPVMANFADYGFCAALEKPYNVEDINRILQKTGRR
jgi:signal transduction histidine kinase/ActR/RegA family two-component response regulator